MNASMNNAFQISFLLIYFCFQVFTNAINVTELSQCTRHCCGICLVRRLEMAGYIAVIAPCQMLGLTTERQSHR